MMNKTLYAVAAATIAAILVGCAQLEEKKRAKPAKISPFIEKPELLVQQKTTFPFHYFYLKKDAGTYKNIYIAPVNMEYLRKNTNWAAMDETVAKQIGSDIPKIADFMRQAYQNEFQKVHSESTLNVVGSPDQKEKTLIVETAIISIVPTKSELVVLGTAGNLLLPGIGIVTGQIATGSITIECMIRDAQTKEIIAMYANTEEDQHAVLNFAGMNWYTSAEHNIEKQANYTARIFSGADYSKTSRALIKLIYF